MTNEINFSESDIVLRKIGRNVMYFQKFEAMLKLMIPRLAFQSSHSQLQKNITKAESKVLQATLGNLSKEFLTKLFTKTELEDIKEPGETYLGISIWFDYKKEFIEARFAAFDVLVSERNKLIHNMLYHFDDSDPHSCEEMSVKLYEQLELLKPEYEWLQGVMESHSEAVQEAITIIKKSH